MTSQFFKKTVIFGSVIFSFILIVFIFIADHYLYPYPYTNQQCQEANKNFNRLKIGMSKKEVIPLIGGERKRSPTWKAGKFPGQKNKNPWMVLALCKNPKNPREWLMIVFDTKTNRVVKIFSGDPEEQGFV